MEYRPLQSIRVSSFFAKTGLCQDLWRPVSWLLTSNQHNSVIMKAWLSSGLFSPKPEIFQSTGTP
jgi:hypothetical protein